MADPVAPAAPPSPAPASPAPAARPGALTGVRYDQPISDQAYDRLGPQEQFKFARVRDAANNPTWQPRSDLAPSPAPKPAAAHPGDAPAPAASVTEAGKLRIGEGETAYELSADDVRMLMAQKAESDLRATQVPPDGNYQAKLPDGFKMPEGLGEFVFTEADPNFVDLKRWAAGRGFDQQTFSEMLGDLGSRRSTGRNTAHLLRRPVSVALPTLTWLRFFGSRG
jgi:hypothetical protein